MRTWGAIAGIFLALAVGGLLVGLLGAVLWIGATDDDPQALVPGVTPSAEGGAGTGSTAADDATATAAPAIPTPTAIVFDPIALSGNGDRTEPITALTPGIAILTMRYNGEGAFRMTLERGDGEPTATLANGRGTWEGSRAVLIREGQQPVLTVRANGPWEVDIERPQPDETTLVPLPYEQSGTGSRALYYVNVPQGQHTLTATHTGAEQFVITIMNESGRGREKLIDVVGAYDDAVPFEGRFFPASFLIVDIRADGDWTLKIE